MTSRLVEQKVFFIRFAFKRFKLDARNDIFLFVEARCVTTCIRILIMQHRVGSFETPAIFQLRAYYTHVRLTSFGNKDDEEQKYPDATKATPTDESNLHNTPATRGRIQLQCILVYQPIAGHNFSKKWADNEMGR